MARDLFAEDLKSVEGRDLFADSLPVGRYLLAESDIPERSIGETVSDLWVSYAGGANSLLKIGGDIYGLATGDMENFASQQGASGQEYWNNRKSDQLKAHEESRKQKIGSSESTLGKAGTAFWETISNPSLMTSFLFEQAPMLLPVAGVGRIAGVGAKALGAGSKMADIAATGGAITTGAVMAGSDAGSQAHEKLMSVSDTVWELNPEINKLMKDKELSFEEAKQEIALGLSQNTAIATAIVSGVTNLLPGARYLEKAIAGVRLPGASRVANTVVGFLGEATQEGIEEGFGALSSNIAAAQVDNDVDIMAGVGEQAGMGAAAGPFGAVAGAAAPTVTPEVQLAEEMDRIIARSGFDVPAEEVARRAFDPDQGMNEVIKNINSAESVDEVINYASQSLEEIKPTEQITPTELEITPIPPTVAPTVSKPPEIAPRELVEPVTAEPIEPEPAVTPELVIGRDLLDDEKAKVFTPTPMPENIQVGLTSFQPKPIKGKLYRETNIEGIQDLLRNTLANVPEKGAISSIFVADDPVIALGQDDNKGVQVVMNGNLVSGSEVTKPGTGIEGITGREFKTDYIGKDAIESFTIPKGSKLKGVGLVFAKKHFNKIKNDDGTITYTRKDIPVDITTIREQKGVVTRPLVQPQPTKEGEPYDRKTRDIQQRDLLKKEEIGDLFATASLPIEERIQQAKDNSSILVKHIEKAKIRHGVETVTSPEDAAHLLAPIRKSAQEIFYALVLDKNNKPIAVIDHSKGGISEASVFFGTVASSVADTPGASSVWLAHNHPSGDPKPSIADFEITEKLTDSIESLGFSVAGHVVLGQGTRAFEFKDNRELHEITIKGLPRKKTTSVTHREIRRRRPTDTYPVEGSMSAKQLINSIKSQDAVILLDSRNLPIASISLSTEEMKSLKNTGVAKRLAGLVSATNASSIILKTKKSDFAASRNIATFADKLDIDILDYFYEKYGRLVSDTEEGGLHIIPGATLFSLDKSLQAKKKTKFTKTDAENAINEVLGNVSDTTGINVSVVNSADIPESVKGKIPKGRRPKGFAIGKTIYLVHDHIVNSKDAQVVLAHELKGHIGVNNIIGNWSEVETLYAGLKKRGGKKFNNMLNEINHRYPGIDSLGEIKEFIAIAAERRETEGSIGAFMRKVRELVKKALTALGFKPISMTDIDLILSRSEGFIAEGKPTIVGEPAQFALDREEVGFDAPVEKRVDSVIRVLQDKFRPVLMTQKEIAKAKGEAINEVEDAYLAEELFYEKTEEDLRVFEETYIEPLAKGLAKYNISREEMDEWLTANHARERNKQIAKINPNMPDGGSGMTNKEADQVHAMVSKEKADKLDELAEHVYGMLEHKRQLMRNGLQSDEITDAWETTYKNYVPLKGMADNEPGTAMRIGKGYDIRGKETMRAMGRRDKAESPVLHSIRDTTESIIRFRKNEVGNVFLKLVEENPNPPYWEIFTEENPDTDRRIIRTAEGKEEVRETPVNMLTARNPDGSKTYFSTKRDGKSYYIKLADSRLNRAMQNMGPEPQGIVTRGLGNATRFLSSMATSYNPEFLLSNMSRDVQTAIGVLMAEQDIPGGRAEGKNLAGKMVKSIPIAMRAIHASLSNKKLTGKAGEWQQTFNQFREDGAKTGWFDMKEIDEQASELEHMVSMARGGTAGNLRSFAKGVKDFVERANTAVENAVRLSVYKHGVDSGLSRKKAASLAKNLTVNFNRKGEIGAVLNSFYMFTNATIQGTAVLVRAIGTARQDPNARSLPLIGQKRMNAAQKLAASFVGSAFLLSMLNREMSDNDDDGINLFDKVPGHIRERNLVIMKSIFGGPQGKYYKIPLPYGFNIFYVLGDSAESAINSDYRSDGKLAVHIIMSMLGSFAPIGFESSKEGSKAAIKTITPTVGKPFVQLAVNENFYGGKIFRENSAYGVERPDSALAKRNTKPHWQTISSFMNEATGGSAFRSGYIDVSPDTLGHFFDFTFSGAGKFADLFVGSLAKAVKGEPVEEREIPFLRKVTGKVMEFDDQTKFYERANEIKQYRDELKSLRGLERDKFLRENRSKIQQINRVKDTEKELSELRKERKEIELGTLSDGRKKVLVDRLEERMDKAIDVFNKRYDKATKGR